MMHLLESFIAVLVSCTPVAIMHADTIIDRVETDQKLVALTFDDGPDELTVELMSLIEEAANQ